MATTAAIRAAGGRRQRSLKRVPVDHGVPVSEELKKKVQARHEAAKKAKEQAASALLLLSAPRLLAERAAGARTLD
jgi:hypothetical protein